MFCVTRLVIWSNSPGNTFPAGTIKLSLTQTPFSSSALSLLVFPSVSCVPPVGFERSCVGELCWTFVCGSAVTMETSIQSACGHRRLATAAARSDLSVSSGELIYIWEKILEPQ